MAFRNVQYQNHCFCRLKITAIANSLLEKLLNYLKLENIPRKRWNRYPVFLISFYFRICLGVCFQSH